MGKVVDEEVPSSARRISVYQGRIETLELRRQESMCLLVGV